MVVGILRSVAVLCALSLFACTDTALVGVADDPRAPLDTAGSPARDAGEPPDDGHETDDDHDRGDAQLGSECAEDDECASGSCEDGVCSMESSGTSCVVDGDCAAGLSCEHGVCIVETDDH